MTNLRLPYFYNLPIAFFVVVVIPPMIYSTNNQVRSWNLNRTINWSWPWLTELLHINSIEDYLFYLQVLTFLPAIIVGVLFLYRYGRKQEVSIVSSIAILALTAFLCNTLPYLI